MSPSVVRYLPVAMLRARAFLPLLAGSTGCEVDLERMLDQDKYEAYEASPWFADDKVMRTPPAGTVPVTKITGPPELVRGERGGVYVARSPVAVELPLLARGQNRFHIFCQPCHGALGDGQSQVAENMKLRPPPSLHEPRIVSYPIGRLYRTIVEGYGLMPAYAAELSIEDRWAVAAFVQALQLSQNVELAQLPQQWQTEAQQWLR